MNMGDTSKLKQAYLAQWLETSRHYLFSEDEKQVGLAMSSGVASNQPVVGQRKQDGADPVERDADPAPGGRPENGAVERPLVAGAVAR